jgi:hypothetical protein
MNNIINTYWIQENLDLLTIEDALIDYKYGFYTSRDADMGKIMVGNYCNRCGNLFWEVRENGIRMAGWFCEKCKVK